MRKSNAGQLRKINAGASAGAVLAGFGLVLSGCAGSSKATGPTPGTGTGSNSTSTSTTGSAVTAGRSLCDVVTKQDVEAAVKGTVSGVERGDAAKHECLFTTTINAKVMVVDLSLQTPWIPGDRAAKANAAAGSAAKVTLLPEVGHEAYDVSVQGMSQSVRMHAGGRSFVVTVSDLGGTDGGSLAKQTATSAAKALFPKVAG